MKKVFLISALSFIAASVHAENSLQWNQASIGVASASIGDDISLSGIAFAGTKLMNDNVFLSGRFDSTSGDVIRSGNIIDLELTRLSMGAGYRHALNEATDVFGRVTFESYQASASAPYRGFTLSAEDSTTGLALEGGIRSMVSPSIELGASITSISLSVDAGSDGSDTSLNANAIYHFNEKYSAGLNVSKMEDSRFTELKGTVAF